MLFECPLTMAQGLNVKGRAYANELPAYRRGRVLEVMQIKNGNKDLPESPCNKFCPINPLDISEDLSKMSTNEITVSGLQYVVCHCLWRVLASQNQNTMLSNCVMHAAHGRYFLHPRQTVKT